MTLKIAALAMAMAVPSMASQSPAGAPTEGLPAFANEAAFQAFLEAERRKAEAQQRREMAEQKMMAMPVPVGARTIAGSSAQRNLSTSLRPRGALV